MEKEKIISELKKQGYKANMHDGCIMVYETELTDDNISKLRGIFSGFGYLNSWGMSPKSSNIVINNQDIPEDTEDEDM